MDFGDTISTTHHPSGPGDKQVVMLLFLPSSSPVAEFSSKSNRENH